MGLTWGDLKVIFQSTGDATPMFIEIVVKGATSNVEVEGFVATDTILRKPIDRGKEGTIS